MRFSDLEYPAETAGELQHRYAKCSNQGVKDAFMVFAESFANDPEFILKTGGAKQGAPGKTDVRFYRDGEQGFAFIPTSEWLLFYVRNPELKHGRIVREDVERISDEVIVNNSGEITIKVRTPLQARKVIEMMRK